MRTHGTLTKWNDDRGFGFIEPATGSEELFVHVSAFPRDGVRPRIGELFSFEIDLRGDGKKQAVRIMRPGSKAASHRPHRTRPVATRQSPFAALAALLAIAAIGWYGYARFTKNNLPTPAQAIPTVQAIPTPPAQTFTCDGRTRCPQMHSCAEATYFIKHCPRTQMDGDGDGVPCERQWCSGGTD